MFVRCAKTGTQYRPIGSRKQEENENNSVTHPPKKCLLTTPSLLSSGTRSPVVWCAYAPPAKRPRRKTQVQAPGPRQAHLSNRITLVTLNGVPPEATTRIGFFGVRGVLPIARA